MNMHDERDTLEDLAATALQDEMKLEALRDDLRRATDAVLAAAGDSDAEEEAKRNFNEVARELERTWQRR